jgi:hypothetical protein
MVESTDVPATRRTNLAGLAGLAALGGIAATLCDANHVATGTLRYPHPVLFGQAWWVLPGFLVAFLAMGASYLVAAPRLSTLFSTVESTAPGSYGALALALASFVLVYLASGFGNASPGLLSLVFYGVFALRLGFTYERAWLLGVAVALGVGGMSFEGALGALGLAAYRHTDVFHVPLWLGGVYMHGAFALREGMRALVYPRRR